MAKVAKKALKKAAKAKKDPPKSSDIPVAYEAKSDEEFLAQLKEIRDDSAEWVLENVKKRQASGTGAAIKVMSDVCNLILSIEQKLAVIKDVRSGVFSGNIEIRYED